MRPASPSFASKYLRPRMQPGATPTSNEHLEFDTDIEESAGQDLVTAIKGGSPYDPLAGTLYAPDRSKEVVAIAQSNHELTEAIHQLEMALTASLKVPTGRVVQQATQARFQTVYVPDDSNSVSGNRHVVKLCNENPNRVRLQILGAGIGASTTFLISTEPTIQASATGTDVSANCVQIATATLPYGPFEVRYTGELWIAAIGNASVGVAPISFIEEFYAVS